MNGRPFKAIMFLVIVIPILTSLLGFFLMGSGKADPSSQTDNSVQMVYGPQDNTQPELKTAKQLGFQEWIIYIGIMAGMIALLLFYLKTSLGWIAVILLPLGFALLMHQIVGLSLTLFYLPNLMFAALLALMIQRLFFMRSIMRFRMIMCSLLGAALLTLNIHALIWLAKPTAAIPTWSGTFVSALIIFVFVTFGLSLADMLILRYDYRQNQHPAADDDEEDL